MSKSLDLADYKSIAEARLTKVETLAKIEETRINKTKGQIEIDIKREELENLRRGRAGWDSPITLLLDVVQTYVIDNDSTVIGSEPAFRSLWTSEELEELKSHIMKKVQSL